MFSILLILIMFIIIAMLWTEGLWGNALTFLNTLFAAMIATNYFEPAADFFEKDFAQSMSYLWDFVAIWGVFALVYLILRTVTDQLSRHRVRFRLPIEIGGNVLFAFLTACVFIAFTAATIHTAPLARTPIRGSFQKEPMSNNFLGIIPIDRMWLAFIHSRSAGGLSSGEDRVFDPKGDFVIKYGQRRQNLFNNMKATGKMRIGRR